MGKTNKDEKDFIGKIDDFSIYNFVLSHEDIKCLSDICDNKCFKCEQKSD